MPMSAARISTRGRELHSAARVRHKEERCHKLAERGSLAFIINNREQGIHLHFSFSPFFLGNRINRHACSCIHHCFISDELHTTQVYKKIDGVVYVDGTEVS